MPSRLRSAAMLRGERPSTYSRKMRRMTSAYLRKAARMMDVGADSCYCSASFTTIKALADESIPVTSHVGLIPSKATWTGGFKAVGKTADQALKVWEHVRRLEDCGALAAELEVVPDRIAAEITRRTPLIMLGMGAGPWADAQCLFAEDVLGCTRGHKPRHAKIYRNFRTEMDRLQQERIAAFGEFKADVDRGAYPEARHAVPVSDDELAKFLEAIG